MHFDIVHAADPRFPGGTSSALRAELKAADRFGLGCAFIPFVGRRGPLIGGFERRTAKLIDDLGVPWLTGEEIVTCDVLFAHHPQVFEHMPAISVNIRPRHVVCVAHHPPFDGAWTPQYETAIVQRNLERLFGALVSFAPVGPKIRRQFEKLVGEKPRLLRHDLWNMIDMADWQDRRRPPPERSATLGRHSRADPLKWPDTQDDLLAAYPDAKHLSVEVLGGIPEVIKPWIGANWNILPYADDGVGEFLSRLDFYVYFHSRRWIEAFGLGIAEAMASGLVAIIDPCHEDLFGEGAVYADVRDVGTEIDRLMSSPASYAEQSALARKLATERFSIETYPARMAELYDDLELPSLPALNAARIAKLRRQTTASASVTEQPAGALRQASKKRVLFVATNGIGLGHITRLMAIAERMSPDIEPIFFTRSAGSALIAMRGHAVDYIPWAVKVGVTDASWNIAYAQELLAAIESMDIAAVVFDGTYPFPGLVNVASARPDLSWVWVRRALWVRGQALSDELQSCFDMIIEPGEYAHDEDRGPTTDMPGQVAAVAPILLNDPGSGLCRTDAAARLGVDPKRFTVAIQLGSQSNFDFEDLPDLIIKDLIRRDIQVVRINHPLAPPSGEETPGVVRRSLYPLSDCLSAVDLMITNASYNSFHECVFGGIPAIFVPNEAPEMDDQHLRATYAHSTHVGLRLRASELGRVSQTIDIALSEDFREELRRRSARLDFVNGAHEAARLIEQLVFSVRADAPLHAALARV
ncbi:glycosyl transferase [Mesorhizobium sp. CGMCC 1.15528]|uniref:Glycosyl transferase n=1 Tax=Mesorhizobium zhangyense TaxID=1776730 RepID=A0A7C9VBU1_9HYPH|nr:glycosyltransferase [Mesorhizobium zhangyense]NGN43426.1 glycosyl transferase [Mesorhizobium zhangyense]